MKNKISLVIPNSGKDFSDNFINEILKINCDEIFIVGGSINIINSNPKLKVIESLKTNNASINRNKGADLSKSEYLLFIDKDVIVEADYINKN
tara:strand:+ start:329 stop:607 length:279 start_codon:yes stop_codon:yes gene_type:complete